MKKKLIGLLALTSISAFAGNPELDAIFKKYEPSLMNFKVGMQSLSDIESTDFDFAEDGTMTSRLTRKSVRAVILKVEDSKTYEYEVERNLTTGEETITVNLNDYKYDSTDTSDITNISVKNHILSAKYSGKIEDQFSINSYRGSITKNLLTSMFCGSTNIVEGEYKDLSAGRVYPWKDNQVKSCNGLMDISKIKEIDLTRVLFCDNTLPDDSESTCETRDMSFLTSDL
jgi:hypothetical protein